MTSASLSTSSPIAAVRSGWKADRADDLRHPARALPFGWDGGGLQNNHHAYDVVRIVNLTWSDLDRTQQSVAKAFLMLLTARSLAMSIDGAGAFDVAPYSTAGEAYYFGLSFFVDSGVLGRTASSDVKVTTRKS